MSLLKIEITDGQDNALIITDTLGEVTDVVESLLDSSFPTNATEDIGSLLKAIDNYFTVDVDDSSLVSSISYNFADQTLEVMLTNLRAYVYENVPASVFLEFISADSKGQYFHAEIKGQY